LSSAHRPRLRSWRLDVVHAVARRPRPWA
jgi:hypothetical protein